MPQVSHHLDGWGPPPSAEASLQGICDFVEHLDKFPLQRIGRICDFTASGQRYAEQRMGKGKGAKGFAKGKGLQPSQPGKDDEGFSLVDNRPLPGKSSGRGRGGPFRTKGRGKGIAINYQEGILGQKQKATFAQFNQNHNKGKGKGKGNAQRRGQPSFKDWSVQTKTDWNVMREISLGMMSKLQIDAREVKYEDLLWCGKLHNYSKEYDRITVRTERAMRRFEDLNFFNVSTSDDPILTEMLQADPSVTDCDRPCLGLPHRRCAICVFLGHCGHQDFEQAYLR